MFGPRIKLPRALHDQLTTAAEKAGYASTEEFVIHVLEREVKAQGGGGDSATDDEVAKQLRGLGYIE